MQGRNLQQDRETHEMPTCLRFCFAVLNAAARGMFVAKSHLN